MKFGPGDGAFGYNQLSCNQACKNFTYFALQAGGKCFCDDSYGGPTTNKRPESECGGRRGLGADWRNSIYETCRNTERGKYRMWLDRSCSNEAIFVITILRYNNSLFCFAVMKDTRYEIKMKKGTCWSSRSGKN